MRFPSKTETTALCILVAKGELTGREVISEADGEIGRGGVYTLLARLEDKGLVKSRTEPPPEGSGGMPRRLYQATGAGQRVAAVMTTSLETVLA